MSFSGRFSRIALAVAGLLAALLILAVTAVPSSALRHLLSNLAQTAIVWWAAVCAFVSARRSSPYFRLLWRLLGAALLLAGAGELLVAYFGAILRMPPTTPWPSDVLLFTWVAPAAMMLMPWRPDESAATRWERFLDFGQIGIVFVTAYLYFFYVPSLWEADGMRMFGRLMEAAVARDVLLAAAFLFRSLGLPRSPARSFFGRMSIFFLALGVTEALGLSALEQVPPMAVWAGAAWAIPFLFLVFVATRTVPREPQLAPQDSDQSVWLASQILPVTIPLLVIFMGGRIAREQIAIAALAVTASFACSAARLSLTIQRQRRIAEDLRRAEHAARQSEQMFSGAFRSSPDAISIARVPEGVILEVNDSYTRLTGFSREEVLGKTPEELGLWVDHEFMTAMRARFREKGELRDEQLLFRRKDGAIRCGRLSGVIITLEAGRYSLVVVRDITEYKEAEDALRASEQRFRTLLETQRVGIAVWGADGRCRFVNRALMEMHGLADIDPTGIAFKDALAAVPAFDDRGKEIPWNMLPSARVLQTRQPVRNQVIGQLLPGSKKVLWRLVDAIPEFTPGGEFAGVISSSTDITDLKRAEEEKRISQEMFATAFHASPDSMTISTLEEGRYIEINDSFTRLFGWRREEVVGKTAVELGIWRDAAHRETLKSRLRNEGRTSQFEAFLCIKSGEVRTVHISADLINLNGEICVLALSHDVTDRKQREEALYASEERFRTLVQNLDAGIVLFSPEGRIQFANQAAQRIFGVSEEEARGRLGTEVPVVLLDANGNEIPFESRPIPRVLATRQPIHNAVIGWRRAGAADVSWLVGNAVPQFSKDGQLTGVIASMLDITEQKRAEEKLRRLSARLLQLQDEERRRLGRDLHDSLAQLVLAVNLRLAQVTQSSPKLDEASRHLLSEARGTLQEMSRQIRTLAYLLHPPLLDELGLASAIREYAQGFGDRSGISLNVEIQADFQRLSQDAETALFRIVQESLTNIQKHSGSSIASIRLHGDGAAVHLEVRDFGRGMPAVTDRRADWPGARFGVGILGMRERLAQLGGELRIESNGAGTTVRARIPSPVEEPHAVPNSSGG
jgi:PAS domain S-box-containing protein